MTTPVVVVGAGLAGMVAALRVAPHPCVLVSPQAPGRGGSTELAQGGLAAAVGAGDDPADHAADTLTAGAGLCDAATVRRITAAGPHVVRLLADLGVAWDRAGSGADAEGAGADGRGAAGAGVAWALGREGGHGRHRIVHAGDRSGAVIAAALAEAVALSGHVTHLAGEVVEVVVEAGSVTGVVVRATEPDGAGSGQGVGPNDRSDRPGLQRIATERVVLASGGAAGLFRDTTNPAGNRGRGMVLAARAGARLADLEFVQFHPTALDLTATPAGPDAGGPAAGPGVDGGSPSTPAGRLPLLTEALRGAGAVLRADGERFVDEVAPRDVVAAAVHAQRLAGRRVELDCRRVDGLERFTALAATAAAVGLDPRRHGLPVCPAAHYTMGGVLTDRRGRTDVPGLWAVGEVACTGLHGANRLASNSLLEAVVTGAATAADVVGAGPDGRGAGPGTECGSDRGPGASWPFGDPAEPEEEPPLDPERTIVPDADDLVLAAQGTPAEGATDPLAADPLAADPPTTDPLAADALVSQLLSTHAGVARTPEGVSAALRALAHRPGPDALFGRLLLRSALRRTGSVGGHRWAEAPAAPHAAELATPGAARCSPSRPPRPPARARTSLPSAPASPSNTAAPRPREVDAVVAAALAEDLGAGGDVTARATIPAGATGAALVVAREKGVVSGLDFVVAAYEQVDPRVQVELLAADGDRVAVGTALARVAGPSRGIVTGERVALNLLGLLSGVATATARLVDEVAGTGTRVADTRKTVPGLRAAQKRAVRHGGGVNHRLGLHDAVMVKDNHIALAGGVTAVLERLADGPDAPGHMVTVEVEVDTLEQLEELAAFESARIEAGSRPLVGVVLLDNMGPDQVRHAVELLREAHLHPVVEVSGGVTVGGRARALAEAGADVLSSGALTHSARWLDVALEDEPAS
ncbi:carboxylating nicotinate-nucleotide diphosphorylase [Kytococcus sp. Marseille-QA3725]